MHEQRAPAPVPPRRLPAQTEFAIVGAGLAGLIIASHFAQAGARVVVVNGAEQAHGEQGKADAVDGRQEPEDASESPPPEQLRHHL